jgi:small subunit ribosomal protein S17
MSDVTNNEEVVETPVAEEVVEVVETVEAEAPVAEEVVEEVVVEAAPAPAPKEKVPATFVIKVPTKTAKVEAAVVESDGTRANARKVREGIVLSNKMDQTLVVVLTERVSHPKYGKTVQRSKKLYVHDEKNDAKIGDRVRVVETRPLSKLKRWRLTEIVERAR